MNKQIHAIIMILVLGLMFATYNMSYRDSGIDAEGLGVEVELTPTELKARFQAAKDDGLPEAFKDLTADRAVLNDRAFLVRSAEGRLGIALEGNDAVTYGAMHIHGNVDLLELYRFLLSYKGNESEAPDIGADEVSAPALSPQSTERVGEASPSESTGQVRLPPEQAEKLQALLKKRFSELDSGGERNRQSRPGSGTVDTSAISETETMVFYSGNAIPKMGYNSKEEILSEDRRKAQVKMMLQRIEESGDRWSIVYPAVGEHRKTIAIFGDPTCPVCQKLHKYVPDLQELGVKVHYLFYNRNLAAGVELNEHAQAGNEIMRRIWCADDSASAMDDAMNGFLPDGVNCANLDSRGKTAFPGNEHFLLGRIIGMKGTPYTITDDGDVIVGINSYAPDPFVDYKHRIGL